VQKINYPDVETTSIKTINYPYDVTSIETIAYIHVIPSIRAYFKQSLQLPREQQISDFTF